MSPFDAAKLLELPTDASPEQIEVRFHELRTRLEDKIAKAPTPGLKAKYRESLDAITTAFETLALAADSSALPVLKKEGGGGREEAGGPKPEAPAAAVRPQVSGQAAPKRGKSSGKEFVLVAVVAVVLLGGGGWFVMKTRAENAAKARQTADLHSQLAEAGVVWEAAENELRDSERQLDRYRSELRSARDLAEKEKTALTAEIASYEQHSDWLRQLLAQHPLKLSRARLESLLAAGSIGPALEEAKKLPDATASLQTDLAANHGAANTVKLELSVPDAAWKLAVSDGSFAEGKGSATIPNVLFGRHELTVTRPPLTPARGELVVEPSSGPGKPVVIPMPHGIVTLPGLPAGSIVRINDQVVQPLPDGGYPVLPGPSDLLVNHRDYLPVVAEVRSVAGTTQALSYLAWRQARNGADLLADFLATIERIKWPQDYVGRLQAGLAVARRAGVVSPAQIAQHYRDRLQYYQQSDDRLIRLSGQVEVCNVLRFHDPDLTRRTLEGVAADLLALSPDPLAKAAGVVKEAAWRLLPETGLRLMGALEEALLLGDEKPYAYVSLSAGYFNLSRPDLAEKWQARVLAARPGVEGLTEKAFTDFTRWQRVPDLLAERWSRARETADKAAIEGLAREMTAMSKEELPYKQVPWDAIADTYYSLGYDQGWLQFISQRNSLSSRYTDQAKSMGRFDHWEKIVRQARQEKTDSQLMEVALGWAARGNKSQARRIAGPFADSSDNDVLARRALLEAMVGDKDAARGLLDRLDKANLLTSATISRWTYRNYLSATAQLLDDSERVARYDEGFDPAFPGRIDSEILAMSGRYEMAQRVINTEAGNEATFRQQEADYLLWRQLRPGNLLIDLKPSYFGREELPLVLLRLQGQQTARSNERIAVPLLPHVPPYRIKRTSFYFPEAARAKGLKEGRVRLWVQVLKDGTIGEIKTLEATDPSFAETFAAAVKQDTWSPALVRGEPVDDWIEWSANFGNP